MAENQGSERTAKGKAAHAARRDTPAAPTFNQAVAEIESILTRLESEEIDIDDLSREVQRAVTLIALCRAKLAKTETEVRDFVTALETEPAPSTGGVSSAGSAVERPSADREGAGAVDGNGLPF